MTSNPLVALYFACQAADGKDGQVRYGYCDRYDIKSVKIIVDVVANEDRSTVCPTDEWLQNLAESYKIKKWENLAKNLSIPHYVNAPFNSPRIIAQQGAFLIAPLLVREKDKINRGKFIHRFLESEDNYDFDQVEKENIMFGKRKINIRHPDKQPILNELRKIGIDESSLFPDTSHIMSNINKMMVNQ